MTLSLIALSRQLSAWPKLRLVREALGIREFCGTSLRREASGALTVKDLRLSANGRGQDAPGWFEADEAVIGDDLTEVTGQGRVRLGLGPLSLEGESFHFDTERRELAMTAVCLRGRDPVLRLDAPELRAGLAADTDGLVVRWFELCGGVSGQISLPWRGEARKAELRAERLRFELKDGETELTIVGGESGATIESRDGTIIGRCDAGKLTLSPATIHFEGELCGEGRVAGASLLDADARSQYRLTSIAGFRMAVQDDSPCWWSGDAADCAFGQIEFLQPRCGARGLGDRLIVQDPGFAVERPRR